MRKFKSIIALCLAVFLCTPSLVACKSSESTDDTDNTNEKKNSKAVSTAYAESFDKNSVMSFEIKVDEEEWKTLLENATDKEYISADITINGTTIKNVGIRAKGNSSLSSVASSDSDRYSFKIKFDEYVDNQTYLGLDKMVLNGNFSDTTSMKEYLSYDIMNYIGVKTPLYAYANITVNEKSWGFYLAIEDLEDSYLNRTTSGEGTLYKPGNDDMNDMGKDFGGEMQMPDGEMQTPDGFEGFTPSEDGQEFTPPDGFEMPDGFGKQGGGMGAGNASNGVSLEYTDDNLESYSAIFENNKTKADEEDNQRVVTALKNLSNGTDLEKYIDVDAVLRYFAAHTVVVNLDSYVSNMGHNYIL